jgi:hypothetical protein
MLEWGSTGACRPRRIITLIIHAAVVEKNGLAAILPAPPGPAKHADGGVALSGWRPLSDELTLIDRKTGLIHRCRGRSPKNQSIDVIRQFARTPTSTAPARHRQARWHMRPLRDSVRRQHETARPGWVIFPPGSRRPTTSRRARRPRPSCFWRKTHSTTVIWRGWLRAGAALIDQAACYDFQYSQLHEAIAEFDRLPIPHVLSDRMPISRNLLVRTLRSPDAITLLS